MSPNQEPHDHHMYSWISFNRDTLKFYLAAVKFYENLLKEDIDAIENDDDLAVLLDDRDKNKLEIYQELKNVTRGKNWLEQKIEEQGVDAWDYDISMSHGSVRFLKSVGLLYLEHLRNRRNKLSTKPNISKYALMVVDQRISYFEEKTEIGVFKKATPQQLLIDSPKLEVNETENETTDEIKEKIVGSKRPRPHIIDSIDIFDPELKSRCLDLFHTFQEDGQNERLDTVVTEATRILETKLRKISNAPDDCVGVDLAAYALGGKNPKLIVSEIVSEQEAAHLLFRGVFGYIRNHVHHNLIDNLLPERVLQIVGMIDYLIFITQDTSRTKNIEGENGN